MAVIYRVASVIYLFALLLVYGSASIKHLKTNIVACVPELVTSRNLLGTPMSTSSRIECLSQCASDERCKLAAHKVSSNGLSTCMKYSIEEAAFTSSWEHNGAQSCSMMELTSPSPCQNGGLWNDPICDCTPLFTGTRCETPTVPSCGEGGAWGDSYAIDGDVTAMLAPVLADNITRLKTWKIGYNDTDLGVYSVYTVDSMNIDQLDSSFEAYVANVMDKLTWKQYDPNASRVFHKFSYRNAVSKLTTAKTDTGAGTLDVGVNITPFNLCLSKQSRFSIDVDLADPTAETAIQDHAKNGYEAFGINSIKIRSSTAILESLFKKFKIDDVSQTATWNFFKFGTSTFLEEFYSQVTGRGINTVSTETLSVERVFFDPGWQLVGEGSAMTTTASRSTLSSHLQDGHTFRVYLMDNHMMLSVLVVYRINTEMYFFLGPTTTDQATGQYSDTTTGETKTLVEFPDVVEMCGRRIESPDTHGPTRYSGVTFKVFVDTRTWLKVYEVSSDSTVWFGDVKDLADGIRAGRDVTFWVQMSPEDRDMYFQTRLNSINALGQVTSESVTFWDHVRFRDLPFTLTDECNFKKVLVTSEGVMEAIKYDLYTAGTIKLSPDVYTITWFLN